MTIYRKKSVVVEAFQLTKANHKTPELWPEWLQQAFVVKADDDRVGKVWFGDAVLAMFENGALVIGTRGGVDIACIGDWVVKDEWGKLHSCKDDIFRATYEPMENGE